MPAAGGRVEQGGAGKYIRYTKDQARQYAWEMLDSHTGQDRTGSGAWQAEET